MIKTLSSLKGAFLNVWYRDTSRPCASYRRRTPAPADPGPSAYPRPALNAIAKEEPNWLTANRYLGWFDRYVHRFEMARFPKKESQKQQLREQVGRCLLLWKQSVLSKEDPYKRYNRVLAILTREGLPEAKELRVIRANKPEDGQLQTRWIQHYLEGELGIAFGSLEIAPEVCDVLYPRLGRVQR